MANKKNAYTSETWSSEELNPLEILLDPSNPRIEVAADADQNEIRVELLTHEHIADLARSIIKYRGLIPGERIITTLERGRQIVLEGNRRICAIQLLLNPDLIPKLFARTFPRLTDEDLRPKIALVSADIAPSRERTQYVLTIRHTVDAVRKWSPVAKMRRVGRIHDKGFDVNAIADQVEDSPPHVRKLLKQYRLLQYAIQLKGWEKEEAEQLKDQRLEPSSYLRVLQVKGAPQRLGLTFDEDLNISTTLPAPTFQESIKKIAKATLIKNAKGRTEANTRSTIKDILGDETSSEKKQHGTAVIVSRSPSAKAAASKAALPKPPKPDRFFETLQCKIQDDSSIRLTNEIRQISPSRTPTAAAFLLRAILTAALEYQLEKTNNWASLVSSGKKPGWHPDLSEIIQHCLQTPGVFTIRNIRRTLEVLTSQKTKDYLDLVVHAEYLKINADELNSLANKTRGVIEAILKDEA
jgi:hypothetical protein